MTSNPVREIITVTDWVWCETEGDIHTATEDPFRYGPQYVYQKGAQLGINDDYWDDPAWVQRTDHGDWDGTLWFYVCPGPHFVVFATHDVPVPELPKRGETERLDIG